MISQERPADDARPLKQRERSRFASAFIGGSSGGFIGILLGLLAGGFAAAIGGQPFSGRTGMDVFLPGMIFPGAFFFAPVAGGIGLCIGAMVGALRRSHGSSDTTPAEQRIPKRPWWA